MIRRDSRHVDADAAPQAKPVPAPEAHWVCALCVNDPYLRTRATPADRPRPCVGCHRERTQGFELAYLAEEVRLVLDMFFKKAPDEPESVDDWINYRETGIYEPPGDLLGDVIEALLQCNAAIAEAVCDQLVEDEGGHEFIRHGGAPEYQQAAFYVGTRFTTDLTHYFAFQRFENRLRFQARYFDPESRELLTSVFKNVHDMVTREGSPISVVVTPETTHSKLYRARVFQSDEPLRRALISPDRELGPPPAAVAVAGRMNAAHIALFYGATTADTALAEVRPPAHSRVLIGRFEVQRQLRLLDVAALKEVLVQGSQFDPAHRERVRDAAFLELMSLRISRPILPDHQSGEYLITQAIADYLGYECSPPFDGMIYPSTQSSDNGVNVVLFHQASRVEFWTVPVTSAVEADLTRDTEEGPEPQYDVVEWVNQNQDRGFDGEDANPAGDDRPITLRLVEDSLEVHHAEKVLYKTDVYAVTRHVIDRSKPPEF